MRKTVMAFIILFASVVLAHATGKPFSTVVTLTSAGTIYPWTIPFKTTALTMKSRTANDFKVSGEVDGSLYMTVGAGSAYYETDVENAGGSLYLHSATSGQEIEILYWKNN